MAILHEIDFTSIIVGISGQLEMFAAMKEIAKAHDDLYETERCERHIREYRDELAEVIKFGESRLGKDVDTHIASSHG